MFFRGLFAENISTPVSLHHCRCPLPPKPHRTLIQQTIG
jgi:hypothetical protein